MELAKIRKFQLQVNAARVSHFFDAETSTAVHGRPWYIKVP